MRFKSLSKTLEGVVKEILGTAFSVGCQVDGRSPKEVSDDINSGIIESKSVQHARDHLLMQVRSSYVRIRAKVFVELSLLVD